MCVYVTLQDEAGNPLQRKDEESYFFRQSKYQDRLVKHIKENPDFILPKERSDLILSRLEEPLRDLSSSRNTFSWGVPIPGSDKHVMYVWFDALSNYLTGVDYHVDGSPLKDFWPCNAHIIGKDIIWFHCVIWPCMLMACDIPLPKTIFAHGFVNDGEGKKMSKSIGNVVDPLAVLAETGPDTLRYFLAKQSNFGSDLNFSKNDLKAIHNSDLADVLGNLVHRATHLCQKMCGGKVPDVTCEYPFDLNALINGAENAISRYGWDCFFWKWD
jgi:methionyl-tRNA synthetase